MLSRLFDAASHLWHAKKTEKKQLDAVIESVTPFQDGHEFDGKILCGPGFILNLACSDKPTRTFEGDAMRTAFPFIMGLVRTCDLDESTIERLRPGTEIAIRAELAQDGKKWAYFVTYQGLGMFTYFLNDIQIGKAENPVNPVDVLGNVTMVSPTKRWEDPFSTRCDLS